MSRRKHKPKSPEQIALDKAKARADAKAADQRGEYGIDLTTHALPQNADIIAITDKAGKIQTAKRGDVFDRLLNDAQLRAVRKLEADIAEQMGQTWRPGQRVTVDSCQFPPGQNVSQQQIDAGRRVQAATIAAGGRCGWLLHCLIVGVAGRERSDWRGIVLYVTGEHNEQAQGARVRAAADNLIVAYGTTHGAERRVAHHPLTA
jgi:hypothetical protein